jgi:hypothetical protein
MNERWVKQKVGVVKAVNAASPSEPKNHRFSKGSNSVANINFEAKTPEISNLFSDYDRNPIIGVNKSLDIYIDITGASEE